MNQLLRSSYSKHRAPGTSHRTSKQETNSASEKARNRSLASRSSAYANLACCIENQHPTDICFARSTMAGLASTIKLRKLSTFSPSVNKTHNGEDSFFHLLISKRASSDEILFILTAESFGLKAAKHLASELGWKCERPLRSLHAMLK